MPGKKGLTPKMRKFADFYVGEAGFNATEAAELAGYKAGTRKTLAQIGYENLRKPEIRAYIRKRLNEDAMSEAEVLRRLADIGRGNLLDYQNEQGVFDGEIAKKSGKGHVIKSMKVKVDHKNQTITYNIGLHNPLPALRMIAQSHQLLKGGAVPDEPLELEKDLGDLLDKVYADKDEETTLLLATSDEADAIDVEAREVLENDDESE